MLLPGNSDLAPDLFGDLPQRLRDYFCGGAVSFPDALDLGGATLFARHVWEVVRSIPYGGTRTYAWVADRIGKPGAARAAGQAVGHNLLPIVIPCHRVVSSRGLGGFGSGLELKKKLLALEAESGS